MEARWVRSLPSPDRCQICGTSLPRGIPAWWESRTGQVWCQGCRPGPLTDSDSEGDRRGLSSVSPDPGLQDRWSRLLGLVRRALQVGSAEARVPLGGHRWAPLPLDQERALCQGTGCVNLHPDLDRLAGRLRSGQTLCYGWPVAVLPGREGLEVAPVFLAELAPPPYHHRQISVPEKATLNPFLGLSETWIDANLPPEIPLGDPESLSELAEQVGQALDLPVDCLDPWRLRRDCARAPGIQNLAMVLLIETPPALRGALEELRILQERSDWTLTAAAALLGVFGAEVEGRQGMPACPVPLERAWEKVLGRLRRGVQTTLVAPGGSAGSLLALAAATNAWLDGDRVLVSWGRQEGLERLLDLAGQIHPGLLVTVGPSGGRQALPLEVARMLTDLQDAPPRGGGQEARQALDQAIRARQEVLVEERRAVLAAELAGLLAEQEELASQLWVGGRKEPSPDPAEVEIRAGSLAQARFLGGLRRRRYLRRLGVQPGAGLEDLLAWARASRASVQVLERLGALPAEDPGLRRERDAAWQRASRAAVAACIRARLVAWSAPLEALGGLPPGAPGLGPALRAVLPGLRGWASTLEGLGAALPLEAGLFDLGILGAADCCNLALALPLAYRCRRLAALGEGRSGPDLLRMDPRRWRTFIRNFGFTEEELEARGLDPVRDSAWEAFARAGSSPGACIGEE